MQLRKLTAVDESKIESYAANDGLPFLGLAKEEYERIRNEVTDVIHVRLHFLANYIPNYGGMHHRMLGR